MAIIYLWKKGGYLPKVAKFEKKKKKKKQQKKNKKKLKKKTKNKSWLIKKKF